MPKFPYLLSAFLFAYHFVYPECIAPQINGKTSVCENDKPLFVSNSPSVIWYSDESLTTIVHTGVLFVPEDTAPGTYTYYAVEEQTNCQSTPTVVSLEVYEKPEAPSENQFQSLYNTNDLSTANLYDSQLAWYTSQAETSPFFIGTKLPDTLSTGIHQYYIETDGVCSSKRIPVSFTVYNSEITLQGSISNSSTIMGKAQLVQSDEPYSIVYQSEIVNNNFGLLCPKSGDYVLRILPYNTDLYSVTYYGNKTKKEQAHRFSITDKHLAGLDIAVQETTTTVDESMTDFLVRIEGHTINILQNQSIDELRLYTIDGVEVNSALGSTIYCPLSNSMIVLSIIVGGSVYNQLVYID